MKAISRRAFVAVGVGLGVAILGFFAARQATTQDARNREIGLSDEQRMTTHAGGVQTSTVQWRQINSKFLDTNPSLGDVEIVYGSPVGFLNLSYRTIEELTAHSSVSLVVRGLVGEQRFVATDDEADGIGLVSTIEVRDVLKGNSGMSVEVVTPVSVKPALHAGRYVVGVSVFSPIPQKGYEGMFFLRESKSKERWVPMELGTYFVDASGTVGVVPGAEDLLKVSGRHVDSIAPWGEGGPSDPGQGESGLTAFFIDADPSMIGIQTTRAISVGGAFNVSVGATATGFAWEAYQVTLHYDDMKLDGIVPIPDQPWNSAPVAGVHGGNVYAFTTGPAFCTPSNQSSSRNLEDDSGLANWAMTCTESTSGTSHTSYGPLVEFTFRCESAGVASLTVADMSGTFLLTTDFSQHNELQESATVTCQ